MPININGTTGIDSPGYTKGGDPVVESGSNSDGEWTKWADGTQQCHITGFSHITDYAVGAVYIQLNSSTWDFPLSFAVAPVVQCTAYRMNSTNAHWSVITEPSQFNVAYRLVTALDGAQGRMLLSAFGRWK